MKYSRECKFATEDYPFKITIFYQTREEGEDQYLQGTLQYLGDNSDIDNKIRISGKHGIIVSPSIIFNTEIEEDVELDIYIPENTSEIELSMELASSGGTAGQKISFGDRFLLSLGHNLINDGDFSKIEFLRNINSIFEGGSDFWRLFNFSKEMSKRMELDDYSDIIHKIKEKYPHIWSDLDGALNIVLTGLLIGDLSDSRHKISGLSDMETVVDVLSEIEDTSEPNPRTAVSHAINKLDQRNQIDAIVDLSDSLNIPSLYPDCITERMFHILISEEICRRGESNVRNLVNNYFSIDPGEQFDDDKFEKYKQEALDTEDDTERVEKWKSVVEYVGGFCNTHNFKFIISNLVYNTAQLKENDKDYYHIVPRLYEAASIWYKDIGHPLHRRAKYQSHYRFGLYLFHNDGDLEEASEHFFKALQIATNANGEYDSLESDWTTFPIIYRSLSDARQKANEGDRKEAAELLEDRISAVKEIKFLSNQQQEEIITALSGERFLILSDVHLREGEYERAAEKVSEAIGLFTEGDLSRARKGAIRKKREIGAVVQEVNGNFEDAARKHRALSEDNSFPETKRHIHKSKDIICESKYHCLNGNYERAQESIRKLRMERSELRHNESDLSILISLLRHFEKGEKADIRKSLEKTSTMNELSSQSHPLDIEYDYTEPIVFILSLQHLRNSGIPTELLQTMVEVSINRAFIPTHNKELADEVHLGDISIDRLWRERLPSPVLSRVEQIQLEKTTAFGNHKSLTLSLAELLEFHLALIVEYYAQRYWGSEWQSELIKNDESEDELTIGILSRILTKDANLGINNKDNLSSIYFDDILEFSNLTEMRNKYNHAYEGQVERNEFEILKDRVFKFLRESVNDAPLIFSVQDQNSVGMYYIRLYWWRGIRHVLLDTEAELERDEYYYLPVETVMNDDDPTSYSVDDEKIYPVQDNRVRDQLDELS
ncbi:hypothetical protein [Natrinema ejinorense]|uniref:hypothetical protein n=1 Tax=Natrinema ejinorense TaxID=373386 RepID=UPI00117E9F8F|nr:hypothetical protein [Natrinema ejinorense]